MSTQTINHGLGVAPELIIAKERESGSGSGDWAVWHKDLSSGKYSVLNDTAGEASWSEALFSNIDDTSVDVQNDSGSGIYLNDGMGPNTYVAYFFASKAGYSKVGSYTGNGSADGIFLALDFAPAYFILKNKNSTGGWWVYDNKRDGYNVIPYLLMADASDYETSATSYEIDFLSNGIKFRNGLSASNGTDGEYIFYAVAESPFKYANAR